MPDSHPVGMPPPPVKSGLSARQIAWRLFATTWIVYALHFSTNVVREYYPAIALGDHLSFDLQEYCDLHPDLFETPGRGCHSGNNPGVSMLAAIPYALSRPILDRIVKQVRNQRAARNLSQPPAYHTPWPNSQAFYEKAWERGLDIKLGLAAFVMQAFLMAPTSAAGVVLVFLALLRVLPHQRTALWLSLLYAFGTPVFFRTGFLNHNLMMGHIVFAGFLVVWNPWGGRRWSTRTREFLCGVAGGTAVLFDYSGVVLLLALWWYVLVKRTGTGGRAEGLGASLRYALGTAGPILLLWYYQYRAFGNPFLPGQHWMPPVEWIDRGYQGYQFPPLPSLLGMLLFDPRFGLFVTTPVVALALLSPWVNRGTRRQIPYLEEMLLLGVAVGLWLFFGGSNYTRLQFNTGIRYLSPILPFLFIPAAVVLSRMRPGAIYAWALVSLVISWPMAMYREVESSLGVLDPIVRTFSSGFALPALTTLGRTSDQYGSYFQDGVSALPVFTLAAALIYGIWSPHFRGRRR